MPNFQLRVLNFTPHNMATDDPLVNVPVEIFDADTGTVFSQKSYTFSGGVLAQATDEEVLQLVLKTSLDWASEVIQSVTTVAVRNLEMTNRYSNLVGKVIDIPTTQEEITLKVEEQTVDIKKSRVDWEIPAEVLLPVDAEPIALELISKG